jgi:hypothetical protein
MKSRAKRQTGAAERPPIPTITGSIRMGSPALLEPGIGVGKRGAWASATYEDSERTRFSYALRFLYFFIDNDFPK